VGVTTHKNPSISFFTEKFFLIEYQEVNLKIITWNVNGLRAVLRKGALQWVIAEEPDFICLQEIKARPDQLTEDDHQLFNGYKSYYNPAERPGYSGVVTYSRHDPETVQLGFGLSRFDQEGRLIRTKLNGINLFNIYFPNGQRDHERLEYKLDFYARLLDYCDRLHASGEKVILCGDFNTAHQEIDLRNPKQNQNTSGFMPIEREWVTKYLESGFVDIFRVLYPEHVQYTWWTYRMNARQRNIGWRLDYFLVSDGLVDQVEDVVINEEVEGSDHCPVTLYL
jgi:exodeoxyribonuclease-3